MRVICATNKNLREEIKKGRFREDLYYRISVVPINLPSLKERRGDIALIAKELLKQILKNEEREDNVSISKEALGVLVDYDWPGNIRELQNWLQFALIKAPKNGEIKPEHFPHYKSDIFNPTKSEPSTLVPKKKKLTEESVRKAIVDSKGNKLKAAKILGVGRATLYRFLDSL